eukprot:TRINITY_DN2201_c1_g2_i2.p1 TRINITY_DN2201_c1_g2~~TRINITY_DN2201_c1_g2_i2.p1  ORF type:complete len:240 (+),score=14.30 TRINITY_DN2201_c1_g2_i2:141-860(+)
MATILKGPSPIVQQVLEAIPESTLTPLSFFISWQGVLTIAYSGFPESLLKLKLQLLEKCENLPKENSGSKWPKTTLGAVKDNRRLTPKEMEKLKSICKQQSKNLEQHQVKIKDLSVVFFTCRSLERAISRQDYVLKDVNSTEFMIEQTDRPAEGEFENVSRIVSEWDDQGYWVKASKDGNRESHYKGSAMGVTLVHYLDRNIEIKNEIRKFREAVDLELPRLYTWFEDDSLHVTIRALM